MKITYNIYKELYSEVMKLDNIEDMFKICNISGFPNYKDGLNKYIQVIMYILKLVPNSDFRNVIKGKLRDNEAPAILIQISHTQIFVSIKKQEIRLYFVNGGLGTIEHTLTRPHHIAAMNKICQQ